MNLQDDTSSIGDACELFDAGIRRFPETKNRLDLNARMILGESFEN